MPYNPWSFELVVCITEEKEIARKRDEQIQTGVYIRVRTPVCVCWVVLGGVVRHMNRN